MGLNSLSNCLDQPRKRIDSKCAPSPQLQLQRTRFVPLKNGTDKLSFYLCILFRAQSIGSANLDPLPPPRSPRLSTVNKPNYSPSTQGYYTYSTSTPPATRVRKSSHAPAMDTAVTQSSTLDPATMMPAPAATPWKRKLSQTMKHLAVSPRFHRKRYDGTTPLDSQSAEVPIAASPQL